MEYKNQENIDNIINFLVAKNYDEKIFSLKEITETTINDIMFLICKVLNATDEDYDKIQKTKYHKSFFDDIKKTSIIDLQNILCSIFRGIVYPPVKYRSHRVSNSIDWHKNTPDKINGYNLYRIDVCSIQKTGDRSSGTKRLIIGKKDGHDFVLVYTDEHDVSEALLKQRIISI